MTFQERDVAYIGHGGAITEAEADSLEAIEARLPKLAITREHHKLRFGAYCGVVRTKLVTIEILPKVELGPQDEETMRGTLVALLARGGELKRKQVGKADLGQQKSHLLDVFIEDFCDQVKVALRGGAIARYTEKTENLNAIRGRLELTEHLRRNAFDKSKLLCRFDERSLDNAYNRVLKAVLRRLLVHAVTPRTRTILTSLLHRFDEIAEYAVRDRDFDALQFDRTNRHWEGVFQRARWLAAGLFPDVRAGDASGSALLFSMQVLFETVLGNCIQRECRKRGIRVELQGSQESLAESEFGPAFAFGLRPDITILDDSGVTAIIDAKWKRLKIEKKRHGVSSADAYQMNAYADRYDCGRLALVYPASQRCPPGLVENFTFLTPTRPNLEVIAIDIRELAFGNGIPTGLERITQGREAPPPSVRHAYAEA